MADTVRIRYRVADGPERTVRGRYAWALAALLDSGDRGVTPIERPAPRWSCYIAGLRKDGLSIETIAEPHGGNFGGTHGRYVLHSTVIVIERVQK